MARGFLDKIYKFTGSNHLFINSIIVISASMLGNIFSYLFQLLSGKYLSKTDFAELSSLFALSGIISLIVSFFTNGIVKIVSEQDEKSADHKNNVSIFFFSVFRINFILLLIITSILTIFSKLISEYLNLVDYNLFFIFIFAVAASVLTAQISPFMQGFHKFKELAFFTILTAITKFSVILVVGYLNLRVLQVFWGLAITTLLVSIYGVYLLRGNLLNKLKSYDKNYINLLFKYSFGSFFAVLGLNLIQNMDIILVKHFFDAETSALYASLSIIGKIIFYAASPIGLIILPICTKEFIQRKNYFKTLNYALLLTFAIACTTAMIFILFPNFVISILFKKYLEAATFLPIYSVVITIHTFVSLLSLFFIAISKFKVSALVLVGAAIQFVGINIYHSNITEVMYVSMIANFVVLASYTYNLLKLNLIRVDRSVS